MFGGLPTPISAPMVPLSSRVDLGVRSLHPNVDAVVRNNFDGLILYFFQTDQLPRLVPQSRQLILRRGWVVMHHIMAY